MKTTSKGKIFAVTTEVSDELLKNLKRTPEILQEATADGAVYWHEGILPKHFEQPAHSNYGYARRAKTYLKQRRKGSKPDLVMSGAMRRELIHNRQVTAGSGAVKLKMHARALNLAPPMPDNGQDLYVQHKSKGGGTRNYPNMKREVKIILDDEREAVAVVVAKSIEQGIKAKP